MTYDTESGKTNTASLDRRTIFAVISSNTYVKFKHKASSSAGDSVSGRELIPPGRGREAGENGSPATMLMPGESGRYRPALVHAGERARASGRRQGGEALGRHVRGREQDGMS